MATRREEIGASGFRRLTWWLLWSAVAANLMVVAFKILVRVLQ